jgi:hypothetical protein
MGGKQGARMKPVFCTGCPAGHGYGARKRYGAMAGLPEGSEP